MKGGFLDLCPSRTASSRPLDGRPPSRMARHRHPTCGEGSSTLTDTVFVNAKPPPHKIMRIVEAMCYNASLRLIEAACEVCHKVAFPWRHNAFSTVGKW